MTRRLLAIMLVTLGCVSPPAVSPRPPLPSAIRLAGGDSVALGERRDALGTAGTLGGRIGDLVGGGSTGFWVRRLRTVSWPQGVIYADAGGPAADPQVQFIELRFADGWPVTAVLEWLGLRADEACPGGSAAPGQALLRWDEPGLRVTVTSVNQPDGRILVGATLQRRGKVSKTPCAD